MAVDAAAARVRRLGHPSSARPSFVGSKGTLFAPCDFPWADSSRRSPERHFAKEEANDMIRYGFTIRSRTGQRIENVSIIAGSQNDAERRLRQMYLQCEILECRERSIPRRFEAANVANMIDLMSISPPTIQHHG